jgi:glycoprotein endo-alpha-1,2-mannosidase
MASAVVTILLSGWWSFGAAASVDLGSIDASAGLANSPRGDNTDGENDALDCGAAGQTRGARRNRAGDDNDYPDNYLYVLVTDPDVKNARRVRIGATFYDDPAFAGNAVTIHLHYTNAASTGPGDLANTFAMHPKAWALSGSGQWVRHSWRVTDAGFRTFMQGTSDFRFDFGLHSVCVDRVDAAVEAGAVPEEHLIGAHYYPWYDRGRWDYVDCYAGTLRRALLPAQLPKLGTYDSSNTAVVDQHLRWCAEYGVSVLILEFIAPGGREDLVCRNVIFPHPRSGDVHFAVMYDWAIRFGDQYVATPERIATARADFDHLARYYFTRPTYLRAGGERPLAMIYVTRALSGDVEGLIGALRDACALRGFDVFLAGDEFFFPSAPNREKIERWDGIFGYDAYAGRGGYWGTNGTLELFRNRTAEYENMAAGTGVAFFPSCASGFNDRAVRRVCADNPALPRKVAANDTSQSFFREVFVQTALAHLDAEVPLVAITSFNEWHEDTQIEPTGGTTGATSGDTSTSGNEYTQGYEYEDYGMAYLEMIQDATIAVTGKVSGPLGPLAGALVEVMEGGTVVAARSTFSTGVYTIPRLRVDEGVTYRIRASASGLADALSAAVTVRHDETVRGIDLTLTNLAAFRRGDANADGDVDISDVVCMLAYLFAGDAGACALSVPRCFDAADANDDGAVDLADPIKVLGYLFSNAGPLPAPSETCGSDLVDDTLTACEYAPCQ